MNLAPEDARALAAVVHEWLPGAGQYVSDELDDLARGAWRPRGGPDLPDLGDRLDTMTRAVRFLASLDEPAP